MRRVAIFEQLLQDTRHAWRGVRRSPGFSAAAVLTLSLGIGATTAIFSVINAVLLRPLPFPEADRLVVLFATTPARGIYRDTTSFPDFADWKSQSHVFADVAAYRWDPFNVTGDAPPELVQGLRASHELLAVLGVHPLLGRGFDRQEQRNASAVALISHALWMRRFGGDRQIVGKPIALNEVTHTVIGVLPQGFQFPAFSTVDVIAPIPERPSRGTGYLRAVARLNPGARMDTAQEEMNTIAARLEYAFPETNRGRGVNVVPLAEVATADVRTPLLVLMGAAIFVLLIGCANVGNLVLAKGIARQRELAVRSALGAGAGRLVRQLLTESVSLALLASVLGAVLSYWGSALLVASLSSPRFVLPPVAFDWMLLAIAVCIAVLSGVLCGLPPALMIWRADLAEALKQGGRGAFGGFMQPRVRSLFVVLETALTMVLLTGAGLLLKSFVLLLQVDPGLDPHHLLVADLLLSRQYHEPAQREVYLSKLLESIGTLPGVQRAAVLTDLPFRGGSAQTFSVEGHADPDPRTGHRAGFSVVSAGYFATMGTRIVRGRELDAHDDSNGMPVAVINETMARRFWPKGDAIGKRIRLYYDRNPQRWLTIVGISADVRQRARHIDAIPQVFVPYRQNPYRHLPYPQEPIVSLAVRSTGDPAALAPAVQARIWAVDRNQPVMNLQPMERIVAQSAADRRIYLTLLGIFATIALVMATAGIYGVSAYAVVRRTQEMGIRMALGATRRQILALVVRHGMLLALIGIALGVAGSLALTKLIAGFLYGVTPTDLPTFAAMALLFAAVAGLATYMPARRAVAIDPSIAFRCE